MVNFRRILAKIAVFNVSFGPGPEPFQTRVRVRGLNPGTRVSDPGLDALNQTTKTISGVAKA